VTQRLAATTPGITGRKCTSTSPLHFGDVHLVYHNHLESREQGIAGSTRIKKSKIPRFKSEIYKIVNIQQSTRAEEKFHKGKKSHEAMSI
jgi:hypothetical protein